MPRANRPFRSSRTRFIRAYLVTFSILFRYLRLFFLARFLDEQQAADFYKKAHKKTSHQIVHTLLKLKGLYIKIGQTLSVMSNILPPEFTEDLEALQDQVPPHPFAEVNLRFMTDFGKPADELYARIDPVPIASASLGQVHVAYHKNGDKLAVKLQYPNIEALTKGDLKTIKNIFGLVHFFMPQYNLKAVIAECAQIILKELDYQNEARNIETIAANFTDNDKIVFPKVYHELTSPTVLTLSFIEGTKISHIQALKGQGVDTRELAVDLIHFYCKQVFQDGVYHADPHPGNIIITPEKKIAMLDFGAVATVSQQMREGMTLFVEGLIKKDTRLMARAIKLMGFIAKKNDDETLERVVEYFYSKIRGIKIDSFKNLDISKFQNLNDLIELKKMDISLRELTSLFVIPRNWILMERAVVLMTGLTAQLDDKLNPVDIVVPYVEKFLIGDPKRLAEILLSTSKEMLISYLTLPDDIRSFIKLTKSEGLKLNAKPLTKEISGIRRSVLIFATAYLASMSGLLSWLMTRDNMLEASLRFETGAYVLGVLFILLMLKK